MKSTKAKTATRRTEMKVPLGAKTIERFQAFKAEGDYSSIARMVKQPPTTHVTVSKYLNEAVKHPRTAMPVSIAKAIHAFYLQKEKEIRALAA